MVFVILPYIYKKKKKKSPFLCMDSSLKVILCSSITAGAPAVNGGTEEKAGPDLLRSQSRNVQITLPLIIGQKLVTWPQVATGES